jgi:hypothetical protein
MLRFPHNEPLAAVRFPTKFLGVKFKGDDAQTEEQKRNFYWLAFWHWVAAGAHLVSGTVIVALFFGLENTGNRVLASVFSDTTNNFEAGTGSAYTAIGGGPYELIYVLFPIPFITGLIHVYQALRCKSTKKGWRNPEKGMSPYKVNVIRGVNRTRWSEYSVTATLMTWIVCQVSGMSNLYVLFAVAVVCNVLLQWQGYFFEEALAKYRKVKAGEKKSDSGDEEETKEAPSQDLKDTTMSRFQVAKPMLIGFVIFATQWFFISISFTRTVNASTETVPDFVWITFFGILGTYLLFPIPQLLYAKRDLFCGAFVFDWYWYEWSFIMLSLASKLLLDWTMFAATNRRE